jgi:hypothetical protein
MAAIHRISTCLKGTLALFLRIRIGVAPCSSTNRNAAQLPAATQNPHGRRRNTAPLLPKAQALAHVETIVRNYALGNRAKDTGLSPALDWEIAIKFLKALKSDMGL